MSESQINKKKRVVCEFEMDLKKSFCWRCNLSNGGIWNHFTAKVNFSTLPIFPVTFRFLNTDEKSKVSCQVNPRDLLRTVFNYLFPYLKHCFNLNETLPVCRKLNS